MLRYPSKEGNVALHFYTRGSIKTSKRNHRKKKKPSPTVLLQIHSVGEG